MDKQEIAEMAIRELTERALSQRRENLCEEEQRLYDAVKSLSAQTRDIVAEMSPEQREILTDYFEKTNLIADHECQHLYV